MLFQIVIISIIMIKKHSCYIFVCFLHLILGIILFCYLLILEINENIDMQEIRPSEYYKNKLNLIIITFNISACFSRFISNGFFFLLIHYVSKKSELERLIIMKTSAGSVMFPNEINQDLINNHNSRKNTDPIFQMSMHKTDKNSYSINDNILDERLNLNNIYEDDLDDRTNSDNRTVNMIRYDSAFLRDDFANRNKNIFLNN